MTNSVCIKSNWIEYPFQCRPDAAGQTDAADYSPSRRHISQWNVSPYFSLQYFYIILFIQPNRFDFLLLTLSLSESTFSWFASDFAMMCSVLSNDRPDSYHHTPRWHQMFYSFLFAAFAVSIISNQIVNKLHSCSIFWTFNCCVPAASTEWGRRSASQPSTQSNQMRPCCCWGFVGCQKDFFFHIKVAVQLVCYWLCGHEHLLHSSWENLV